MKGGINSQIIADVRLRASILEVVSESVVLKRAGKDHRGLCPFHQEKTPSFHVSTEKGFYKCFGCGERGDVFTFVQKVKGLDFVDAVKDLAQKYGVALVETAEDRERYDRRAAILNLYEHACTYFQQLLKDPREGAIAREYLEKRGMSDEIVEKFRLGYAANAWDGLLRYLTSTCKVASATLEEAGLVRRKPESSSYYDLFRHRLMIPILDGEGRVIAFGGRTLGDDQVKYINSPESPIYTKGQHLFALNLAKDSIKANDAVIVVEGYFDAITPHQFGFTNTVATLGTALTEQQARLLVRYTESKRVYLAFDSDAPGAKAVNTGGQTLNQIAEGVGIELRVIKVPGGKDPDECLRSETQGLEAFQNALLKAPLLIDYQLEQAIESTSLSTHTGRIEASRQVVPILSQIKNAVARGEYVRQWALRLAVREEDLASDVRQYRKDHKLDAAPVGSFQSSLRVAPRARSKARSGSEEAERQLLALFLTSRDDYALAKDALADTDFSIPAHRAIKEAIDGIGTQFNTVEDLQVQIQNRVAFDQDAGAALIEVILKVDEMRKENLPVAPRLFELMMRIRREQLEQVKSRLRASMSQARDESEQIHLQSTISQLMQLERNGFPKAATLTDLVALKRKIDELISGNKTVEQVRVPELETTA